MNLPPRAEGEHHCLGELVRLEAIKMRGCAAYMRGDKHMSAEDHLAGLEARIWQWLLIGWTRLRDDGVLVHWHPEALDWVPFTRSLHDTYTRMLEDAWTFVSHKIDQAKATYTGKPAVVFDASDTKGRIH